MKRRAYKINTIVINKIEVNEVIIDPHTDKHSDHISDELILELVLQLHCSQNIPDNNSGGYQYFVSEISFKSKLYKMVWLLEDHKFYVGILTTFRDRRLE